MSAVSFSTLMAVSWLFTGSAVLLTVGRFWIRCKIVGRLSWEDAAHLLGLLLLVTQVSTLTVEASMIYQKSNSETVDDGNYEADHLLLVRLNFATVLITWCCLYAVKASFMLLYHHIFQISQRFIRAWWIVLGMVILTFCVLIAGSLTECGSPSALDHVGMSGISFSSSPWSRIA